jgi:hypothetical protein
MIRQILVGVAVAALSFGTVSCGGEIPSCDEVPCAHPQGNFQGDGIFTPVVAEPAIPMEGLPDELSN